MKFISYPVLEPDQSLVICMAWTPETEELMSSPAYAQFDSPFPSEEIAVFMVVYRKKDPDESSEDILKRFPQANPGITE